MQQEWYFKINNIEVGPLDAEAFFAYAEEGRVTPETSVKLGDGEWTVASNVEGLFPGTAPAAQAPAPSQAVASEPPPTKHIEKPVSVEVPQENPIVLRRMNRLVQVLSLPQ